MRSPVDRFWAKADRSAGPEGCWVWTGAAYREGYGSVKDHATRRTRRAHRVAWEIAHGDIPNGLWVLHKCDNPPCVNPAHLFLGTHADNMVDKFAKGRAVCGEQNRRAKLTEEGAREAFRLTQTGLSDGSVGELVGVSSSCVRHIRLGYAWGHLQLLGTRTYDPRNIVRSRKRKAGAP
jgi:hypothetical protein